MPHGEMVRITAAVVFALLLALVLSRRKRQR
jgi:hypothetical protein